MFLFKKITILKNAKMNSFFTFQPVVELAPFHEWLVETFSQMPFMLNTIDYSHI